MDIPDLTDFSFLDPKMLGQLIALLLIWVQFSKDYVPDKWIKVYSLVCALLFSALVDGCTGGPCAKVMPAWFGGVSKFILYGVVSSSAAGLGYKAMVPKNGSLKPQG